jgi:hypothetical protein
VIFWSNDEKPLAKAGVAAKSKANEKIVESIFFKLGTEIIFLTTKYE